MALEFVGVLAPFLAAGGWLRFIRQWDRFEREPWRPVLIAFALGATAGLVGLIAWALLVLVDPAGFSAKAAMLITPIHVVVLAFTIRLFPYRWAHWNDSFDGIVYGGAVGIGYGLLYSQISLLKGPLLGFRSALFTMPVFMLAGLIIGFYLSQVRFGARDHAPSAWAKGLLIPALYLVGFELTSAWGGAVMGEEHPLASAVVYATNTVGWVMAMWAMDANTRASQHHPENYRLQLSGMYCSGCGVEQTVGAVFCHGCGRPGAARQGVQGQWRSS